MLKPPYPQLSDLLTLMGDAGQRLSAIEASEGAAGNISLCLRWQIDLLEFFPVARKMQLPCPVPELENSTLLVTGSGRRLREIKNDPAANIACIVVNPDGVTANLFTSQRCCFQNVTSEFNSHLMVHYDQVINSGTNFHVLVHAQPVHLTFLSHILRYQEEQYLNTHLLRWQPEMILNLPEGIGLMPFLVPGSAELMTSSVVWSRNHQLVIWAKHGVMARSDSSLMHAVDLVEYAETAARYEYMNLATGEIGTGLSREEILAICQANNIKQTIF